MNIDFFVADGEVKEWVIDLVKEKLLELYQLEKNISKARVNFKEQTESEGGTSVCEIELTIYGNSLFVHRNAASFEQAAREVMTELEERVKEQMRNQNQSFEEITSTVSV